MATNTEMIANQRRQLFMLLKLEKAKNADYEKVLNDFIVATKTEMQEEDVAYVEKMVSTLK